MQCERKAWDSFVVPWVATMWLQHRRRRHRARSASYPTTPAKTCTEPGEVSRRAEFFAPGSSEILASHSSRSRRIAHSHNLHLSKRSGADNDFQDTRSRVGQPSIRKPPFLCSRIVLLHKDQGI